MYSADGTFYESLIEGARAACGSQAAICRPPNYNNRNNFINSNSDSPILSPTKTKEKTLENEKSLVEYINETPKSTRSSLEKNSIRLRSTETMRKAKALFESQSPDSEKPIQKYIPRKLSDSEGMFI